MEIVYNYILDNYEAGEPIFSVDIVINGVSDETVRQQLKRLTDRGNNSRAADVIRNWLRNRGTLEYLSTWEQIYNPQFKVFESEHFKKQAGLLTFTPSVSEWVEQTNAIGLYVKRGKYGGTYAHKDIAEYQLKILNTAEQIKIPEKNNDLMIKK